MGFGRSKKSITGGIVSAAFSMMGNLIKFHLLDQHRLSPLYVVWHPTLRCNLSCHFCDNGRGKKYPDLQVKELSTEQAFQLLDLLRQAVKAIYFTGGEPFIRKDMPEILSYSKRLGFQPIFVNTNLTQPGPLEESIECIDVLVVSLGSTDCEKYDSIIKGKPGQTARIIDTLEDLARKQKSGGPLIVVNCVISADRVKDAHYVYELCKQLGIWFSPVPEIKGCYVDPHLTSNQEYQEMVSVWLEEKKNGQMIYGSFRGLGILLKEKPFQCYPPLAPQVYPNGDLMYPCKPLSHIMCNILENGSFNKALKKSLIQFPPIPHCDNRCHMACYVNNNQWMEHPLEMILENLNVWRKRKQNN